MAKLNKCYTRRKLFPDTTDKILMLWGKEYRHRIQHVGNIQKKHGKTKQNNFTSDIYCARSQSIISIYNINQQYQNKDIFHLRIILLYRFP